MSSSNKVRQAVYEKYDSRCAFCGDFLEKGWHVWDIVPIQTGVSETGDLVKLNTDIENLMPACKSCGSVRIKNESGKMNIERFRKEIVSMYVFCRDGAMYATSLQRAIKFGIVTENSKPIIFYFERLNPQP